MAWRAKIQKRRRRGQRVVGARLVFDNGLTEDDEKYQSEEMIWIKDKIQSNAEFKAMIIVERDAWIRHFNRLDAGDDIVEVEL